MSEKSTHKTVLGADCRINGELLLDNDAVIMGHFEGTLRVTGVLELTDSAHVSGTIIAGALRLAGRVDGDVVAEQGVELLAGAQLNGQLYTTRLSVIEGAVFQGDVCVGPKAMQAAGALLRQLEEAVNAPVQPAVEQAVEEESQAWDTQAQAEEAMATDQDMIADEQPAVASQAAVRTVPSSLSSILDRRRASKPMPVGAGKALGLRGQADRVA